MYDVYICVLPKQEKVVPDISPIPWFQHSEQTAGQGANRLCQVLTSLEVSITMSSIWIKLGM